MKKIPSLFKRDYEGDSRLVLNEITPGCEWVTNGEGVATRKLDGRACMISDGKLYTRYDRKLMKGAYRRKKREPGWTPAIEDFKPMPEGWIACEDEPNVHTGHWPGWVPCGDEPQYKMVWEGYYNTTEALRTVPDGTYELLGPKVQGNPEGYDFHMLVQHGSIEYCDVPTTFDGLKAWLGECVIEGIVWHHPDGRMCKIKRRDFGYGWP